MEPFPTFPLRPWWDLCTQPSEVSRVRQQTFGFPVMTGGTRRISSAIERAFASSKLTVCDALIIRGLHMGTPSFVSLKSNLTFLVLICAQWHKLLHSPVIQNLACWPCHNMPLRLPSSRVVIWEMVVTCILFFAASPNHTLSGVGRQTFIFAHNVP